MKKCAWVLLGSICLAGEASAANGHCPTAPQNYDGASCYGFCGRDPADNTSMLCDLSGFSLNNDVVVVKNYKGVIMVGGERYSAWGTVNGLNFCCTEVSSANSPLNSVVVLTGIGADEVWFTAFDANGIERNLTSNAYQTAPDWFVGYVYPGTNNDYVQGSNSTASDYMDHLTGENGADQIWGNKGADFISVSEVYGGLVSSADNHGEAVYGGNGRDEIVGAVNNVTETDVVFVDGGAQNDLLCSAPNRGLTGYEVYFFGGDGDDEIYSESSYVAGHDGAIDGGSGSDGCSNPGGSPESNCQTAFNPSNFTAWPAMMCN